MKLEALFTKKIAKPVELFLGRENRPLESGLAVKCRIGASSFKLHTYEIEHLSESVRLLHEADF